MRSFAQLFAGGIDCYTAIRYVPGSNQDGDKLDAQVQTVHEEPTEEIYAAHVNGKRSIGIVPIRRDDTVSFVVLDVDAYTIQESHEVAAHVWGTRGNQFIPCLSKSNGLHLYAFFEEPVPAKWAREYAATWAQRFGLKDPEIFPKQDKLRGTELGNAINLPYFGSERPAIEADGQTISLDDFLEIASNRLIPAPKAKPKGRVKTIWESGPPCIQAEVEGEAIDSLRDEKMYQMMTFAMKMTNEPTAALDLMGEWNAQYFKPPLPMSSLTDKQKQLVKGRFGYKCDTPWAKSVCDRQECVKREFGIRSVGAVAGFTDMEAVIEEIIELYGNTGAPQYKVKIYGQHVLFEGIEEITNRDIFINKVLLVTNKALVWAGKHDKFAPFIRQEISDKRVVDERSHNEFLTLKGIVLSKFKAYVRDRANKKHINVANSEGHVRAAPGEVWVPVSEVLEQMEKVKAQLNRKIHRYHIDAVLFDFGCNIEVHEDDGNAYYVYRGELWFPLEDERVVNQAYQ